MRRVRSLDPGRAAGWVAMLRVDDDDATETAEFFCPDCAARELGRPSVEQPDFNA